MELTRWGPWAPWATKLHPEAHAIAGRVIIGPTRPTPWDPSWPIGLVQRPIVYLMDTHKHTFPTLRAKQPIPHNSLRDAPPPNHAISALVIIGPMWCCSHDGAHGPHGPPHRHPSPCNVNACHHWPHPTHPMGPIRPLGLIGQSQRASFERAPSATWDSSK